MSTAASSTQTFRAILQIGLGGPLPGRFDYLAPADSKPCQLRTGCRVRVRFAGRMRIGIILAVARHSQIDRSRLQEVEQLLEQEPVITPAVLALLQWAAGYYHHPEGDTVLNALPALLRRGKELPAAESGWRPGDDIDQSSLATLGRSPAQHALLQDLLAAGRSLSTAELIAAGHRRATLRRLQDKGLMVPAALHSPAPAGIVTCSEPPQLNPEQQQAVAEFQAQGAGFHCSLLQGITGSGKTEVYLAVMEPVLQAGQQVLVLVPEIALTSQTIARFQQRFAVPIAVLHSGKTDKQRLLDWQAAGSGHARIVIGTRSSVWAPLPQAGLIIVDEEHDPSYKQQEGLRYSARDVAVMRARQGAVPVMLGSATPSLESLDNVAGGRYRHLQLTQRAGPATPPQIRLIDCRQQGLQAGMSRPMLEQIERHLHDQGQVMVFVNRRGYAPVLLCHECGWTPDCRHCDAHLTWHRSSHRLHCHHCGSHQSVPGACPQCNSRQLIPVGQGTERLEETLARQFPQARLVRIDRDTVRQRGRLEQALEQVRRHQIDILIGTQMLAKGHDFPGITLVCIIDTDNRLYSSDFRASERLAQLLTQVAGRTGRAEKAGSVLIQTHHPEHPLLQTVINQGYARFAASALAERRAARLPPCTALALLRASSTQPRMALDFLQQAWQAASEHGIDTGHLMGPLPAPMERRENRYHAQLYVQADSRAHLHHILCQCLPLIRALPNSRTVRWSIDVDPQELL